MRASAGSVRGRGREARPRHVWAAVVAWVPVVLFSCFASWLTPPTARADGGFFFSYWADVWEPSQRAILIFDPEAGHEDLIIQAEYEGTTDSLAWIVPVPALPTLAPADAQLFVDCAKMTRVQVRQRRFDCGTGSGKNPILPPQGSIDVYADQQIGIYRTLIIGAADASVLADSLETWGFLHQDNRAAAEAAFQFYIDKSWFFVAMRTDPASLEPGGSRTHYYGGMEPIRLGFATPNPVYPMRISAISAPEYSQVLLYVFAPHRMTFPGATAEYANDINARELRNLGRLYPTLGSVIPGRCFLTKLRWYPEPRDMTDDLVLSQAPDDTEFRRFYYAGMPGADAMLAILLLAGYAAWWYRRRRRRSS